MKKIFRFIALFAIVTISFWYTEKLALIMQNKDPLLQKIKKEMNEYQVISVNGEIQKDTIIPGIYGKKVNINRSFNAMKKLGIFDENYLVYSLIKPAISIEDNLDKVIISGNKAKASVSILVEQGSNLLIFLQQAKIAFSVVLQNDNLDLNRQMKYLNGAYISKFSAVEKLLSRNKLNQKICVVNNNQDICQAEKHYLIKPSLTLNQTNYLSVKPNINNGSIILIKKNVSVNYVKLMLKEITFKGLKIVDVADLIKEI